MNNTFDFWSNGPPPKDGRKILGIFKLGRLSKPYIVSFDDGRWNAGWLNCYAEGELIKWCELPIDNINLHKERSMHQDLQNVLDTLQNGGTRDDLYLAMLLPREKLSLGRTYDTADIMQFMQRLHELDVISIQKMLLDVLTALMPRPSRER